MLRLPIATAATAWDRAQSRFSGGTSGVPDKLPDELFPPDRENENEWTYAPTSTPALQRLRQGASVTYGGRLTATWGAVHRGLDAPAVAAVTEAIGVNISDAFLDLPNVRNELERAKDETEWIGVLENVWGATSFGRMVDLVASVPMVGTLARLAFGLGGLIADLIGGKREAPIVIDAEASRYSQKRDVNAFYRLRDVLRQPDESFLDVYSPIGWQASVQTWLPMHARIVGTSPLKGGGWRFEAKAPDLYGWGAMPGGRNVHAGIEVLPRGDRWIVTDPGAWLPTMGGQTPAVWESIRPVTRAPTVRVFDLDSAELERRWTFYLAALRESISVSGDLPPAARTAALLWGVGAGLWTTPPHELGARIDAVGPPAVIAAIRGLRSAQRVVAQSIDVLSMGGRVSAPIYQHIDPEIRDLAISTYNRILATPEVLCRVNLERIDADQRDWIRTMQAERCTPADTAGGFPLAAGPWALPPPIVPSDTPAGGYGAKLGDPLPGGDGGSMAAAILMGGAVVAAVGFGVFRRRKGKR